MVNKKGVILGNMLKTYKEILKLSFIQVIDCKNLCPKLNFLNYQKIKRHVGSKDLKFNG